MSSPYDLLGGGNSTSGFSLSTDYVNGNMSAEQLSNVKPVQSPRVYPAYKGNIGRKNAMMGNWENPVQGQGTFFPQDDTSFHYEPFDSDKGAAFAREM